jgi:hypothetical protein
MSCRDRRIRNETGDTDERYATLSRAVVIAVGIAGCATLQTERARDTERCGARPYYTDNLMHNLRAERFYRPRRSMA